MAGPDALLHAIFALAPPCVLAFYVAALVFGICMLRESVVFSHNKFRNVVIGAILAVAGIYIGEVFIIIPQLWDGNSLLATPDANFYAVFSALIWILFTAALWTSTKIQWYPFQGSWLIATASEVGLFAMTVTMAQSRSKLDSIQISMKAARIFLLVLLLMSSIKISRSSSRSPAGEEEPLLDHSISSATANGFHRSADGLTSDPSQVEEEEEEEDVDDDQEEKEKLERLRNRLQEDGNWFSYISAFSIFVPYIWPTKHRRLLLNMAGVFACLLCERVLNALVPRQLGLLVNSLQTGEGNSPLMKLVIYSAFLALSSHMGITLIKSFLWLPVQTQAIVGLETASFNHIMSLSCDFHDNKQSGELYQSMEQGESLVTLLNIVLLDTLPITADLAIACIYLYHLFESYMALIVGTTIVAYVWVSIYMTKFVAAQRRVSLKLSREKEQVMYDTVGGWKTVSYFNRMDHAQALYAASVRNNRRHWQSSEFREDVERGLQALVLNAGRLATFFFAVYQVMYNNKSVGSFVTLLSYWINLTTPIGILCITHQEILRSLIDAEQLLELFRIVPTVQDGPNQLQLSAGGVTFENATFSYDGHKEVVHNISFTCKGGQTIALVGDTGAGKSTILRLLFRFYDVNKGAIYIDGQDIRDVTLESLRDGMGVVSQDPTLFNNTIMSNVRYARLDATDAEVMEACRAAAVHDKILTFHEGYHTRVGERGVKLSGGELQRLAIARAILKDPKIILLDEATSAVDSVTEGKIQDALRKLCRGRTTFVVAHRLSTIIDADVILVFRDGAIVEQGSPKELVQMKKEFYRLWSKQIGIVDGRKDTEGDA